MAADPVARLGEHHAAGVAILNNELKRAHDATSDTAAIEREIAWTAALEDIAQPFGPAFVWQLVPFVGEMEIGELGLIREYLEDAGVGVGVEIEPRSVEHAMSLATLATRLHRINAKLKQLDAGVVSVDAPPTKKGRGRPVRDKWSQRNGEWAALIYRQGGIDHEEAAAIAKREGIEKRSVLRGARDANRKRREADNADLIRRLART